MDPEIVRDLLESHPPITTPGHPHDIVAAEHTAQLGEAQGDAVFSKAEEHELGSAAGFGDI